MHISIPLASASKARFDPLPWFAALTLGATMVAGAWQMVAAAHHPDGLVFARSWLDFREGRMTGQLEKQLEHKLPARPAMIAAANGTRYLVTGGAGEQVRSGKDGWLFLAEELRFDEHGAAHLAARATLLGGAAQALKRQGVRLLVAVVPDKARVYPQHVYGGYPAYLQTRYAAALAAMRARGVHVVDLLAPLQAGAREAQVYYSSDTHWNQQGARVAAGAIAQAVHGAGVQLPATNFDSRAGAPAARAGDLIGLMGVGALPAGLRPPFDVEAPASTRQTSAEAPAGLFGDEVVPVVLTGTSFSLRGNFHGYLQQALKAKVLNTAKDGGGFLQAPQAYFKDEAFATNKPTLLVWEVPERMLQAPLTNENGWLASVGLAP
jgi:alginate O-acetyltransferase complex protein AlgJ